MTAGVGAVDALPGVHGATAGLPGETGLDRYRLAHRALPGRDLSEVTLRTRLLGAELAAPVLLVGSDARTASEHGLGLVGNDHAPDRPPLWLASFDVSALRGGVEAAERPASREVGGLGRGVEAAERPASREVGGLGRGVEAAERLVAALEADGLVLHLDGMREPVMRGAIEAIAAVVERLAPLPVIARGGGFGLDPADVRELRAAGVAAVDVGGAAVAGWGVPTADALAEAVLVAPGLPALAEVDDGADAAKCLALGATAVSVASAQLDPLLDTLRMAVWSTGAGSPAELTPGHLRLPDPWRPPLA